MLERRGVAGMATDRLRRIGLPLLIGWSVIFPMVKAAFVLAAVRGTTTDLASAIMAFPREAIAHPWASPGPAHIWFLWYLLWLYPLAVIATIACRWLRPLWREYFIRVVDASIVSRYRGIILGLAWMPFLLPMKHASVDTPTSFAIKPAILAAYAFPFLVGWRLWYRRDVIAALAASASRRLRTVALLAAMACLCLVASLIAAGARPSAIGSVIVVAVVSISVWLFILTCMGLCESIFRTPGPIIRRMADASYWIYFVHLPLCVVVPLLLRDWPMSGSVKMLVTTLIVIALSAVSFESLRAMLPYRTPAGRPSPELPLAS